MMHVTDLISCRVTPVAYHPSHADIKGIALSRLNSEVQAIVFTGSTHNLASLCSCENDVCTCKTLREESRESWRGINCTRTKSQLTF